MIVLNDVSKTYGNKDIVKNLSLHVHPGELCVLLGQSGCGKSTTLHMINKLEKKNSGKIYIGGEDTDSLDDVKLRRNIGYVVQSISLFPNMNVYDNISVVLKLLKKNKNEINKRVHELFELIGLDYETYHKKFPSQLSGGEAQRVGVARALAANPKVLLMDEPFAAIDPLKRKQLQDEFLKIQKSIGITVIFVTHDISEAIKLGDKIALMNEGKIVLLGTPTEIIKNMDEKFSKKFFGKEIFINILERFKISQVQLAHDVTSNIFIDNDSTLKTALSLMIEKGEKSLTVKNKNGEILGGISIENILSTFSFNKEGGINEK